MSDTTQPGTRVDAETWKQFRQFVAERHGSVRGNLRRELEAALNDRMDAARGPSELERIEDDVATIKAMLAESDGGTPTPQVAADTRTRGTSKPDPNQPRSEKVSYLIEKIEQDPAVDESGGELAEKDVRNIINDEYGFQQQTEDEYFHLICDRLDAEPNPLHGRTVVWGDRLQELKDDE